VLVLDFFPYVCKACLRDFKHLKMTCCLRRLSSCFCFCQHVTTSSLFLTFGPRVPRCCTKTSLVQHTIMKFALSEPKTTSIYFQQLIYLEALADHIKGMPHDAVCTKLRGAINKHFAKSNQVVLGTEYFMTMDPSFLMDMVALLFKLCPSQVMFRDASQRCVES